LVATNPLLIFMIIITGASRGIGKAVAELYLSKGRQVLGIGRTTTIEHKNYSHLFCDLSSASEVEELSFPEMAEDIVFIHNAGVLGEIGRFTDLENTSHSEVMQVNFSSGMEIFYKIAARSNQQEFTCVFISSGAGKRPIASWASYCASKAAVDLFLETVQAEENEKENSKLRVYSFSPGVVDTAMQEKIRKAGQEDFSAVERFKGLHANGDLLPPEEVAEKLSQLIHMRPLDKVLWTVGEIG